MSLLPDKHAQTATDTGTDTGTGTHYIGLVPDGLKAWMKLRIGSMYELSADVEYGPADFKTLPYADAMLDNYRVELA